MFEPLLHHPVMHSLGWALVHFLWQGAALAALLAGSLRLLRSQTAQARYLAACAVLALMATSPAITVAVLRDQPQSPRAAIREVSTAEAQRTQRKSEPNEAFLKEVLFSAISASLAGVPARFEGDGLPPSGRGRAVQPPMAGDLEPLLPGLVSAWLIGVVVLSLRLLGGWVVVRRLTRRGTRPMDGRLAVQVAELARRLGVRRPVTLWESVVVPVPTVIGWLRAAILFPAGALSGLPPRQLEAILAHELAHIRRHDYLVNLAQTLVETLLFYHPAVWWVSRVIRVERENCCDDLAVEAFGDRITYARALAALEVVRGAPAVPALAATGGDLLARIRRLLGQSPEPTDLLSVWLGGTVTVLLLLATFAIMRLSAVDAGDRLASALVRSANAALLRVTEVDAGHRSPSRAATSPRTGGAAHAAAARARRRRSRAVSPAAGRERAPRATEPPVPSLPAPATAAGVRLVEVSPFPHRAATPSQSIMVTSGRSSSARRAVTPLAGIRVVGAPRMSVILSEVRPIHAVLPDGIAPTVALTSPCPPAAPRPAARPMPRAQDIRISADADALDTERSDDERDVDDRPKTRPTGNPPRGKAPAPASPRPVYLVGLDMGAVELASLIVPAANLKGANLAGKRLAVARLASADLAEARLTKTDLSRADLTGANLSGAHLAGANLTKANLSGANLRDADLSQAHLEGANLRGADLTGANLTGARLGGAALAGARLRDSHLAGVDLVRADLAGADMADVDLTAVRLAGADLVGVNLADARLAGADLTGANLKGANLGDADLSRTLLARANLFGANLGDANLSLARLEGAILFGANLSGANLKGANLLGVDLSGVDLSGASRSEPCDHRTKG